MHPDRRYRNIQELRQELFPPTTALPQGIPAAYPYGTQAHPPTQVIPARGRGIGVWIGIGMGGVLLVGGCIMATVLLARAYQPPQPTAHVMQPLAPTSTPTVSTLIPTVVGPSGSILTETAISPPTATPVPVAPPASLQWTSIGYSVRNRDLLMAQIGYEGSTAVVVVGSIQGDQINTRDLTNAVISHFQSNPGLVPANAAFYFIPSANPDGNASNSRYNANGVDLNRNWDTDDWRSNPAVPGYPDGKPGAGGSSPFSEPETRALRDLLLQLRSRCSAVRVVVLHSSVRRSQGEIYPGGSAAIDLAQAYAAATGYDIEFSWAEYVTSGELVTWCDEEGMLAIDVVVPGSQQPSSSVAGTGNTLLGITVEGLLRVASYR